MPTHAEVYLCFGICCTQTLFILGTFSSPLSNIPFSVHYYIIVHTKCTLLLETQRFNALWCDCLGRVIGINIVVRVYKPAADILYTLYISGFNAASLVRVSGGGLLLCIKRVRHQTSTHITIPTTISEQSTRINSIPHIILALLWNRNHHHIAIALQNHVY